MTRNTSGEFNPRIWYLTDTISPVFSNLGFRNWDLCLAKNGIVAVPRSLWITFRASVWAALRMPLQMQRSSAIHAAPRGDRILNDDGCTRWRRYSVEQLDSITVQRRFLTASEIRIKAKGKKEHIYGGGAFQEIMRSRSILKQLYPNLYVEKGRWPKNLF